MPSSTLRRDQLEPRVGRALNTSIAFESRAAFNALDLAQRVERGSTYVGVRIEQVRQHRIDYDWIFEWLFELQSGDAIEIVLVLRDRAPRESPGAFSEIEDSLPLP